MKMKMNGYRGIEINKAYKYNQMRNIENINMISTFIFSSHLIYIWFTIFNFIDKKYMSRWTD